MKTALFAVGIACLFILCNSKERRLKEINRLIDENTDKANQYYRQLTLNPYLTPSEKAAYRDSVKPLNRELDSLARLRDALR